MRTEPGWVWIGTLMYLDADDREHPVPHDGRGVLTFYGDAGKESWAAPEDDLRLIFNPQTGHWGVYVPSDSETGQQQPEPR